MRAVRLTSLFVAAAVAVSILAGSTSVHADAWKPVYPNGPDAADYNGVILQETFAGAESNSGIIGTSQAQIDGMPNDYVCDLSRTGDCDPAKTNLQAFVDLPPCSATVTASCIESLEVGSGTEFAPATLTGMVGGNSMSARPSENLPLAATTSLWQGTAAGQQLSLAAIVVVRYNWSNGAFRSNQFEASLVPYSLKTGAFKEFTQSVRVLPNGRSAVGGNYDANCVWQDTGRCGVREDFPAGVAAKLTLRLDSGVGGWFKGRLTSPDFQVRPIDAHTNLVQVTGSPAAVPQVAIGVAKSAAPAAVQAAFSHDKMGGYVGGYVNIRADYPNAPELLSAFREVAQDKSQGMLTQWTFGSFPAGGNPCLADTSKLLGLVTTNASVYEGQAPAFTDSSLVYKVAGYHYLADGSLNLGTYDLIMRKETARCLYGFSSAPISASVSVTSESGSENVATTNFTESGDWDHFSAYGFTFSNPRIQVKLNQAAAPTPKPSTPSVAKKTTITCVKGKVVKKVTAVSPKCPAGYKKK